MIDLKERIATTVRSRRKLRGLSQEKLVEKIGINVESLSSIERGANLPSIPTLVKLAEALEFDVAKLLMPRKSKVSQDRARLEAEVDAIVETMPEPVLLELRDIALVLVKRGKR
jgi:transcriptional regulator with XRE-family HTH domain